jgi:hypothetical protein
MPTSNPPRREDASRIARPGRGRSFRRRQFLWLQGCSRPARQRDRADVQDLKLLALRLIRLPPQPVASRYLMARASRPKPNMGPENPISTTLARSNRQPSATAALAAGFSIPSPLNPESGQIQRPRFLKQLTLLACEIVARGLLYR